MGRGTNMRVRLLLRPLGIIQMEVGGKAPRGGRVVVLLGLSVGLYIMYK